MCSCITSLLGSIICGFSRQVSEILDIQFTVYKWESFIYLIFLILLCSLFRGSQQKNWLLYNFICQIYMKQCIFLSFTQLLLNINCLKSVSVNEMKISKLLKGIIQSDARFNKRELVIISSYIFCIHLENNGC